MKPTILVLFVCLILSAAPAARADYAMDIDYACFRIADTLSYVEIYVAVHQTALRYKIVDDSLIAEFTVALDIVADENSAVSDTFRARDVRAKSEEIAGDGSFYTHAFRLVMKPGEFALRALLFHWEPQPISVVTRMLVVPAYDAHDLAISGIEMGSQMDRTDETDVFVKNGLRLIPNPTAFYGSQVPILFWYAEIYGLDFDSSLADSHVVTRRVLEGETEAPVRSDDVTKRKTTGESVVFADGFPVATLRTGTYYLEISVRSLRSGREISTRKKFWTYRKEDYAEGRIPPKQPQLDSQMAGVAPDFIEIVDPDSAAQWMRYLLTPDDNRRVRRLNAEGKRQFVRDYWQKIELQDNGAGNRYFARIVESNHRYSYLKKPGWKTDRGRVFVLYGEPDRIQRNYAMLGSIDNEVWEYNQLEGGVVFIFADEQGFGDLDLVHSTKRGEINNPDWEQRLRSRNQSPGPNDPSSPGRRY